MDRRFMHNMDFFSTKIVLITRFGNNSLYFSEIWIKIKIVLSKPIAKKE